MFKDKITSQGEWILSGMQSSRVVAQDANSEKVQKSDDEELEEFLKA